MILDSTKTEDYTDEQKIALQKVINLRKHITNTQNKIKDLLMENNLSDWDVDIYAHESYVDKNIRKFVKKTSKKK